jgi:hypothetical protein
VSAHFDPKRVAVIDLPKTRSHHLLVRGNMPLVGNDFAYPEIESALSLDFSADRFVSASFIDNTGERSSWSNELNAFGEDPGKFPTDSWPPYVRQQDWNPKTLLGNGNLVYGSLVRPRAHLIWWPFEGMAPHDDSKVFLHSPGWDFAGCVDHLYNLYLDLKEPATVYYVHCMMGADRTGALHAGLLIRAGVDVEEALKISSNATPAGAPNSDYLRLVRAYAASRVTE